MAFWFAHLQNQMKVTESTKVEYRYLPLSIDQWFKESQYAASDVMNSLIEDTNGYCDMGGGSSSVLANEEEKPKETEMPKFAGATGANSAYDPEPQVMFI